MKNTIEAEDDRALAEASERDAREELERLQRELKIANPKVTEFKVLFQGIQEEFKRLNVLLGEITLEDADTGKRLLMALVTFKENCLLNNKGR